MKRIRNVLMLVFLPVSVFAASGVFPFPAGLADEVRFWKMIFGTYTYAQIILHDSRHAGIIYEVMDFTKLNRQRDLSREEKSRIRKEKVRQRVDEISQLLQELANDLPPEKQSPAQRYYKNLFREIDEPDKFQKAAQRIHIQAGQKENFKEAISKSKAWIGDMQSIFEKEGLPKELIGLVFVESMFNPQAVSAVGASGLWQLMPETGKNYLPINAFWDSRNDPLHSSWGAASFFKDLYRQTRDWALAVNAYHTGPARIRKAVKQLGTRDISVIIERFEDPQYAFYSRNYYPQFLAVNEIYQHQEEYLGELPEGNLPSYDIVITKDFAVLPEVMHRFAMNPASLRALNTTLSSEVWSGELPLPPHFPLKVPKGFGYYIAQAIGYPPP